MIGEGPQPHVGKMEKSPSGRTWYGENSGSKWRGLGVVQKVFGLCAVPCGIEDDEPLKARREGHERAVELVENHRHAGKKGEVRDRKCYRMERYGVKKDHKEIMNARY